MNTFLPFPSFARSAACLDSTRLHNQLNECKVIQAALAGAKAWSRHPATLMWEGHTQALTMYMAKLADEMCRRGMKVPAWAPKPLYLFCKMPPWMSYPYVYASHRGNLLRKDPQHYGRFFPDDLPSDVYAWPTRQANGTWIIRFKQVGAKKYKTGTEPLLSPP